MEDDRLAYRTWRRRTAQPDMLGLSQHALARKGGDGKDQHALAGERVDGEDCSFRCSQSFPFRHVQGEEKLEETATGTDAMLPHHYLNHWAHTTFNIF